MLATEIGNRHVIKENSKFIDNYYTVDIVKLTCVY